MLLNKASKYKCLPHFFFDQLYSEYAEETFIWFLYFLIEKWKFWCGNPSESLEETAHVLIAFSRKTMK